MGKSKTTIHERQLTPEERQLIEMQGKYLNSIQPSIDALVNYGTNQIQNIVTLIGKNYTMTKQLKCNKSRMNLHHLAKVSYQAYLQMLNKTTLTVCMKIRWAKT